MAKCNGHPSWAAWNVTLWLSNDEGLYTFALAALRTTNSVQQAARRMLEELPKRTPDGAVYTQSNLRYALNCIAE